MINKIIKIFLVIVLGLTITGCMKKNKDPNVKTISVGISPDYAPYELKLISGELVGFDIDMINLFEEYLSEIEGVPYEIEIVEMEFDSIVIQLHGKQIDVGISGFSYDEDRLVEWSKPYLETCQVAVLPKDSSITSIDELKGKTIAAQTGSTGEAAANEIENAKVSSVSKVTDIFVGLAAHQYDAVVVDLAVAQSYIDNSEFRVLDEVLLEEKNYIIARKGNIEVIELMNQCIDKFLASEDYKLLCQKYGFINK